MFLVDEFKIFIKKILYWILSLFGFSFLFLIFGIGEVNVFGRTFDFIVPSKISFSVEAFNIIQKGLLPSGIQLVVTNPMSAFVAQVLLSIVLSFLVTLPFLLYGIISYIHPALTYPERRAVILSLAPFLLLFLSGCAFSYFFLVPATFEVLYPYAVAIDAAPFFSVDEFIYYVSGLIFVVGVMFLLPIFMIVLSFLKIINPVFWKNQWRIAILLFLILCAIITPDGTGVTMILLFLPLMVLYFAGYYFANRIKWDQSEVLFD